MVDYTPAYVVRLLFHYKVLMESLSYTRRFLYVESSFEGGDLLCELADVSQAVDNLPLQLRNTIRMYCFNHKRQKTIARILKCNQSTVSRNIKRGIIKVVNSLKNSA